MCYLHEHANVVHRDLKAENILVFNYANDEIQVKICDFGVSKKMRAVNTSISPPSDLINS